MKSFLFFLLCLLALSCRNERKKNFVSIEQDSVIIAGDIVNDTIYNDTISYFDLRHTLLKKEVYKNGKREGSTIDYFSNNRPKMITFYSGGLKNGYNSYYDSSGNCYYKDYYYHDLTVGPIIYFDSQGSPKRYFFVSLQNETLFDINYLNWGGIKDTYLKCINFFSDFQKTDTTKEMSIFLYLINAPKFSFNYSLYTEEKKSKNGLVKIDDIKSALPFKYFSLPLLPEEKQYLIGVEVYDSLLNKKTVVYKEI